MLLVRGFCRRCAELLSHDGSDTPPQGAISGAHLPSMVIPHRPVCSAPIHRAPSPARNSTSGCCASAISPPTATTACPPFCKTDAAATAAVSVALRPSTPTRSESERRRDRLPARAPIPPELEQSDGGEGGRGKNGREGKWGESRWSHARVGCGLPLLASRRC